MARSGRFAFPRLLLAASLLLSASRLQSAPTLLLPKLQRTAQSSALGDGAAHLRGLNALGVNPAGLPTSHLEVLTQYEQLLGDSDITQAGLALPLKGGITVAGSYLGFASKDFDKRDAAGRSNGSFRQQDQMVALSLGQPFPHVDSRLRVGASVKYLRFDIDATRADTTAADLGLRYALPRMPLTMGASVLNLGREPVFLRERSPLPRTAVLSAAYAVNRGLTVLASYTDRLAENRQVFSMGVEAELRQTLLVRGRYALAPQGQGSAGLQNLSAGLGVKFLKQSTLDYAFQPLDSNLREDTLGFHRMTVTFRFGLPGAGNPAPRPPAIRPAPVPVAPAPKPAAPAPVPVQTPPPRAEPLPAPPAPRAVPQPIEPAPAPAPEQSFEQEDQTVPAEAEPRLIPRQPEAQPEPSPAADRPKSAPRATARPKKERRKPRFLPMDSPALREQPPAAESSGQPEEPPAVRIYGGDL